MTSLEFCNNAGSIFNILNVFERIRAHKSEQKTIYILYTFKYIDLILDALNG